MNINALISFVRVAERGSFSQAARELNYTQSAVTIQVQQLEKEFSTIFFDRIGHTVQLTTPGKVFYQHARKILTEIRLIKNNLGVSSLVDPIHVGTIDSLAHYLIEPILPKYYASHPQQSISITTGSPAEMSEMLNKNELDLAYLLDQPLYDVNWEKPIDEKMDIVFVASKDSPLAEMDKIGLADLTDQSFLLTEKQDNYRHALDREMAKRKLRISTRLSVSNTDIIVSLVEQGIGISFLPRYAVEPALQEGKLVQLHVYDFDLSMNRQLIYHKDKWLSQSMVDFIELLQKNPPTES